MLQAFMGQCSPDSAFHPISSLNDFVSVENGGLTEICEVGDTIADPTIDIEGDLANAQLQCLIRRFVVGLSPHLQCIVVRHYVLGHSQTKIADDLGVSRSAVCHALRRVNRLGLRFLAPMLA